MVIIIALSGLIHNFTAYVGVEDLQSAVHTFFQTGQAGISGGVVGGFVASGLSFLFGKLGTTIVLVIVLIIMLMIITKTTPLAIYKFFKQRAAKREQRDKEDEEEYLRRARKEEEKARLLAKQEAQKKAIAENQKRINLDIPLESEKKSMTSEETGFNFHIEEPLRHIEKDSAPEMKKEPQPMFDEKVAELLNRVSLENKTKEKEKQEDAVSAPLFEAEKKPESAMNSHESSTYIYPPLTLLKKDIRSDNQDVSQELKANAVKLVETLKSFGVSTQIVDVSRGPTVTRYELSPSAGVKVSKIVNLADDIALNLASAGVRIEAPIPGKAAVGIEVPNRTVQSVFLRDILSAPEFLKSKSSLTFALGKDVSGNVMVGDIAKMPHLLIAGATGSGKSVCINTMITSILYKSTPDEVKLLMVDPKVVELGVYNSIPHLLIPVVTDPKKAAGALRWAVNEMLNRYKLFAESNVRDLKGYNEAVKAKAEENKKPLPQIVIIIDELADLMMAAPNEVEDAICRLAQMARAAGMHLVIATQRPSVDVITGVIKANIPSRILICSFIPSGFPYYLGYGRGRKAAGKRRYAVFSNWLH